MQRVRVPFIKRHLRVHLYDARVQITFIYQKTKYSLYLIIWQPWHTFIWSPLWRRAARLTTRLITTTKTVVTVAQWQNIHESFCESRRFDARTVCFFLCSIRLRFRSRRFRLLRQIALQTGGAFFEMQSEIVINLLEMSLDKYNLSLYHIKMFTCPSRF